MASILVALADTAHFPLVVYWSAIILVLIKAAEQVLCVVVSPYKKVEKERNRLAINRVTFSMDTIFLDSGKDKILLAIKGRSGGESRDK
jgi:hypothetical protein